MQFDVAVIGGGPGGYVAAIKAAQLGRDVCLIEKNKVGGTCLNVGCIPTKYLLTITNKYAALFDYQDIGINIGRFDFDFARMIAGKDRVVQKLINGVQFLLKKNKVTVYSGAAAFADESTIQVTTAAGVETVTAQNIIIATGSAPLMPQMFGYDGDVVCSSTEALSWQHVPGALLIVGGGVIGCELATIYANLGTEVTVVEMQERLIPTIDAELGRFAEASLRRKGVGILTQTRVEAVGKYGSGAVLRLSDGREVSAEKVVVSVGRSAELDALNLQAAGVEAENGKITVDGLMRTNRPEIYAIGDVCSSPCDLAHSAMKEGLVAVENICGNNKKMCYDAIPNCVYTAPEMATVGMSQQEARDMGIGIKVGRFSFAANGKAVSMGEAEGFVKIIAEETTGRILGAQMAGPHVTDLIAQMAIAVENKLGAVEVADVAYAHPTLSEAIWESLESSLYGHAIHS